MYWSQVFILPQKVLKMIQQACRIFLWTGKTEQSKRALVAWETIMLPQNAGGLNVVNLGKWNRAAIGKHLWNLARKKDRIWIKWVHIYYIKQRDVMEMDVPKQCSWVVKKIIEARDYMRSLQAGQNWMSSSEYSVKQVYVELVGTVQRVQWAKMICQNGAPPKCKFTIWLLLQGKLPTCRHLQQIGIQVDQICCLCGGEEETVDHLFFGCVESGMLYGMVMTWCGLQRGPREWNEEKPYLISQCTNTNRMQKLYRCSVTILAYHVWQERNQRRMQGRRRSMEEVARQCQVMISWCARKDRTLAQLRICN